jgi:hypothetical protein
VPDLDDVYLTMADAKIHNTRPKLRTKALSYHSKKGRRWDLPKRRDHTSKAWGINIVSYMYEGTTQGEMYQDDDLTIQASIVTNDKPIQSETKSREDM